MLFEIHMNYLLLLESERRHWQVLTAALLAGN